MRKLPVSLFVPLALVALVACGGKSGGGHADPADVGKALISAAKAGDADGVRAVFPTAEQLAAAMDCEADKSPAEKIAREANKLAGDINEIQADAPVFKALEPGDQKVLAVGDERRGCTAKVEIAMMRAKMRFEVTRNGEKKEHNEGVELIKLGDAGWFLLDM